VRSPSAIGGLRGAGVRLDLEPWCWQRRRALPAKSDEPPIAGGSTGCQGAGEALGGLFDAFLARRRDDLQSKEAIKGVSLKAYDLKLSDAFVSSFENDPGPKGVETALTFDYRQIKLTDQSATKHGIIGTPQTFVFDLSENKIAAAVSSDIVSRDIAASAGLSAAAVPVPASSPLHYFLKVAKFSRRPCASVEPRSLAFWYQVCAIAMSDRAMSDRDGLLGTVLAAGYPNGLLGTVLATGYPNGLLGTVLATGYPNGLFTGLRRAGGELALRSRSHFRSSIGS
jgi:hypothetical protein